MAATVITTTTEERALAQARELALLRLLQLVSPSFPVGAFAYSQGLESAINNGWVHDMTSSEQWLVGLLKHTLATLEVPIIQRSMRAWAAGNLAGIAELSCLQLACREARELQEEDLQLGRAMLRALSNLGVERAADAPADTTYAVAFGLGATHFEIDEQQATSGFLYAWCDNQVIAASRLIPLGQNQAQRVLASCLQHIPGAVARGLQLDDDDIGLTAPGLGMAAAQHETQYARLFRS